MQCIDNKTRLLACMEAKAVVITPNNRLSNELLTDFFHAHSLRVQEKPRCLPYTTFLHEVFKQHCYRHPQINHPLVVNTQQLRHLWQQILANSSLNGINEGLLHEVAEAWTRCHLWQINLSDEAFAYTPQTRQFQQWAQQLKQRLQQLNAITEVELADYLLSSQSNFDCSSLVWACFDDFTPQQRALQAHFNVQGKLLFHYDLTAKTGNRYQFGAADETDERLQLIHWINEKLAQGEKRIAVVVPDLNLQANSLQRLMQQHFADDQFNISLGQALTDYTLVSHALYWLALGQELLDNHQARLLLHSPYLAYSKSEMLARAQIMEDNAFFQEAQFSLSAFIAELKKYTPKLAELLANLSSYPQQATPLDWINLFKQRLKELGFPGEYTLNSASYQCHQRFINLLDELKQLTLISPVMSLNEALSALTDLASHTIFQAQNKTAAVHILGLLEASGCTFNSCWITGLTDQCLPQKAHLSAFIPVSIQRENEMPHASPERELRLAQTTLTRLQNSSQQCVLSYPHLHGDRPSLPSPLLAGLPFFAGQKIVDNSQSLLVETNESYQISFSTDEKPKGGTAILANQAKCPFRAFATHRLHAKKSIEVTDGPDFRERGQVVHKVLELLWQTLQSQENLLALAPDELDKHIEQAIHSALKPLVTQRTFSFSSLIQDVELTRLKHLIHTCLQWEKQRPPFKIEKLEHAYSINLAGIDFQVRVDRLDEISEGKKWVIDYKTTLPKTQPWKEERPQEPQLLLYALLDETINSLLFVELKAGQFSCKGLSEDHKQIGVITLKENENWTDYRQRWQIQLNQLAQEFSEGHCLPMPNSAGLCAQCDYPGLCRFTGITEEAACTI